MNAAPAKPQTAPMPADSAAVLGVGLPVAALALALIAATPPLVAFGTLASLALVAIVAVRPYAGALVLTAGYPLMCWLLDVSGTFLHEVSKVRLFPMDLLAAPLLAGLALNRLRTRRRTTPAWSAARAWRWMLWFAAAFFLWAATRVSASEYTVQALLGFARVLMAGGVMLFLASTVDTERRFLLLFRVYCAAAAVMAVMAVVATYHAFSVGRVLHASAELQVEGTMMLYNTPAGFNHAIVGMVPGYGLTPKHNLSLYLTAAIVFAFLLLLRAESRGGRTLLGALMVLYASVNHQAFSRLALAGLLLTTAGVLFLVRRWRARIPLALAALLALYTVGYACSRPFFPEHVGERESLTSSLTVVASESQYSANSLAGRVRIWKDAWRRIQQRLLLGRGPESLGLELAAGVPTAHNVVLSLWGDYGLVGVLLACGAVTAGGVRTHAVLWRSPEPDDGRWQLGAATTLTALLALFVYSFDLPIWSPHLWFMLGLLLAAVRLDEAKA